MADPLEDSIVEERVDLMSSVTGGIPTMRLAHFLKPTVSSIEAPNLKLPFLSPKSRWLLRVDFNGWRNPQRRWNKWVDQMQSRYQNLWKRAGIFEAIMFSKYRFHKHEELIFGVAERWCCDTNTFVFPWGEATVTLEDVMILGGFSVLGFPVFSPVVGKELEEVVTGLRKLHEDLPKHVQWQNFFMGSGREDEHEAFLALWLSRFVFPGNEYDKIGEYVFPVAVYLARGIRIALAPAVLASIYKDLSLLKESMAMSVDLEVKSDVASFLALGLWAPMQLVQLWVWERFLVFKPEPNFLEFGQIRAARWDNVKRYEVGNVRPIIDSCGDTFLWRPYCLAVDEWSFPKFYKEKEESIQIGRIRDDELESFARCLRVSELVGIDCAAESYQPHRVAMQFGLDQDLPAVVSRWNESHETAWFNYIEPFCNNSSLYLPTRLFESDLSAQYQKWWLQTVLVPECSFPGVVRGVRTPRRLCQNSSRGTQVNRDAALGSNIQLEGNGNSNAEVPPGFPPKRETSSIVMPKTRSGNNQLKGTGNDADVPPGFPPKRKISSIVNGNDADVPPGFPPKTKTSYNGNDADVPPGFPPKKKTCSIVKLETCSSNSQLRGNGNDADVPPGFPPKGTTSSIVC